MGIEEFILQRTKREEFERGRGDGREMEKDSEDFEFTKVFLNQTDYSMEEIAYMMAVPISFVQMVKNTLG